ncbi:MAG TPA: DUF6458 family protein [Gaiellaceae bacterium]|nr:DUF6458 family protein [Gaiellaceae bacterium]
MTVGIGVSLIITVVGFILALAVHPTNPHSVNVNTVGWILVVVGLIGFVADLLIVESWGPRYFRRRTYAAGPAGYPADPALRGYPRRRVIEEDEVGPR